MILHDDESTAGLVDFINISVDTGFGYTFNLEELSSSVSVIPLTVIALLAILLNSDFSSTLLYGSATCKIK